MLDLNLDVYQFEEAKVLIGRPCEKMLNVDGWTISRATSIVDCMGTSNAFVSTIWRLLESNERLTCTGAALGQANLGELGTRPVSTLTLKILGLNFGMDTEIMSTLLSMNSGVELMSLTSYDGLTDTPWSLKLRVRRLYWPQQPFGSLQT